MKKTRGKSMRSVKDKEIMEKMYLKSLANQMDRVIAIKEIAKKFSLETNSIYRKINVRQLRERFDQMTPTEREALND